MPSLPPPKSNVIPLEVGQLTVRRRPGRPKKLMPAPTPTFDEAVYYEELARAAESFIGTDPVVAASTNGSTSELARIDAVLRGLAEEQAVLLYQRLKLQREGRAGAAQTSSRRVDALLKIARLVVLRQQLRADSQEPEPEHVEAIVKMLMEDVESTVNDCAPAETAEKFLGALKRKLAASNLPYKTAAR